ANPKGPQAFKQFKEILGPKASPRIEAVIVKDLFAHATNPNKNVSAAGLDFDYPGAARSLKLQINRYSSVLDDEAIQTMEGAYKLIERAGQHTKIGGVGSALGSLVLASAAGSGASYMLLGDEANKNLSTVAAAGLMSAGALFLAPIVMQNLSIWMANPKGQSILRSISEGNASTHALDAALKSLSTTVAPARERLLEEQNQQAQQQQGIFIPAENPQPAQNPEALLDG